MPISDLPTLAEVNARPRATPKYAIPSRLAEKTAEDKAEKKAEAVAKKAVWTRDRSRCRVCGCRVLKALDLTEKRGEVHHVAGRADRVVRWDPRNLLLVCAKDHERLERNQLLIVATARQMFVAENGKSYIDATKKIKFKEAA